MQFETIRLQFSVHRSFVDGELPVWTEHERRKQKREYGISQTQSLDEYRFDHVTFDVANAHFTSYRVALCRYEMRAHERFGEYGLAQFLLAHHGAHAVHEVPVLQHMMMCGWDSICVRMLVRRSRRSLVYFAVMEDRMPPFVRRLRPSGDAYVRAAFALMAE